MSFRARAARQVGVRLVLVAFLAFLGSYGAARLGAFDWPRRYDPLALPDLRDKPFWFTDWQMKLMDADAEGCARRFRQAGLDLTLRPERPASSTCERSGTIDLSKLSVARVKSEETRCAIAARLYMWERHMLQPAARRLLGVEVAEILHFGSYSCRTIAGRSAMSEHATANAFDISGFRLANGRTISVKHDWPGAGEAAQFLRIARDGLCDWFNVTLSPDYNAAHADHFHVDMGWYRTCR